MDLVTNESDSIWLRGSETYEMLLYENLLY